MSTTGARAHPAPHVYQRRSPKRAGKRGCRERERYGRRIKTYLAWLRTPQIHQHYVRKQGDATRILLLLLLRYRLVLSLAFYRYYSRNPLCPALHVVAFLFTVWRGPRHQPNTTYTFLLPLLHPQREKTPPCETPDL